MDGLDDETFLLEANLTKVKSVINFFIRMFKHEIQIDSSDFNIVKYTVPKYLMETNYINSFIDKIPQLGDLLICKPEYFELKNSVV